MLESEREEDMVTRVKRHAWEAELRDVRTDYVQTVASISAAARAVMARSSRAVSRCDPRIYIRGSNYINYSFRILYVSIGGAMRLAEKKYVRPWPRTEIFCYGTVSDCTQRRVIKGCLAAPGSGRRYKAIIERGGFLDFSWYYKGPIISESECDSDPMIPDLMYYNNYACICTEPSTIKKNAYLNKTAVYSDVANNRVITGIRFRTRWAITYLEVQEGEMVNGSVLPQSVRWREDVTRQLEDYERRHYVLPDDFELGKNDEYVALPDGVVNPNFDSNIVNLRRADVNFNLDDIILPAGMVVTGVRFTQLLNGGIALMVEGSKAFDDIGNFKFSSERQWFSNTNYLRNPIILNDHDNPLDGPKQNKELSTPGRSSIALQLSDWTRDGRQSLIPFIDLQQVVTSPPSPIGGLGGLTMPEWKGRVPLTRSHCERITGIQHKVMEAEDACAIELISPLASGHSKDPYGVLAHSRFSVLRFSGVELRRANHCGESNENIEQFNIKEDRLRKCLKCYYVLICTF
ncbi:hypothetical protein EVAR_41418_1 [Eumeta japonica]|uniref:Uncharacterized protein n=1 Tax=Eumeta variegata TaxID=151549 RepID=A0A4C1W7E9_EUMVA|nr:hypothetical protein EVAR_41418_1 [Eumeta japonica]